jgi:hypothetical protein
MEISENTTELILDIKEFSGDKLKNENDVSILLETTSRSGNHGLFNEIIFTAKYLNGLGKILHSNISTALIQGSEHKLDDNAEDKIRNEFSQNVVKLSKQITKLTSGMESEEKKRFGDKYLSLNRTSLVNLTNLIYDLSWVKQYYNSKK